MPDRLKAVRQEKILDPLNSKADKVMVDLKSDILKANCSMVKSVADVTKEKLNQCKSAKLTIVKAQGKSKACKTDLNLTSTIFDRQACLESLKL